MLQLFYLALLLPLVWAQNLTELRQDLDADGVASIFPGNPLYRNATEAYNLRYTVSPVAVTYPASDKQVSTIISAGAKQGLNVVARSGGHSYIANGLGGKNGSLVVDLGKLLEISYNKQTGIAVVGSGNRLGDVAVALNKHGRGLPHGRCNSVGIGGHAAAGGWGFASRMWGLTLDNIQTITVVLSNGSIVNASRTHQAELFWGLRGAAPSFGIVTAYHFLTHAVPPSASAFLYAWNLDGPSSVSAFLAYQTLATSPNLPAHVGFDFGLLPGQAGNLTVVLLGVFYGPEGDFNRTISPLLNAIPPPYVANVTTGDWITAMEAVSVGPFDTSSVPPTRDTFYAKSLMTAEPAPVSTEAMEKLVSYLTNEASSFTGFWHIEIELYGGAHSAINAVPRDATAFVNRDSLFTLQIYVSAPNGVPPFPDGGFALLDDMQARLVDNMPRNWTVGAYPNYIEDRLDNWEELYYGENYPRLQKLKVAVDPRRVFEFPFSIEAN